MNKNAGYKVAGDSKRKNEVKKYFKMPSQPNIKGRSSSITNAFVCSIIPVIEPNAKDIEKALETLGMDKEHVACAYCGDPYTEWDHFHPLVKDKKPTGYISEINNLVPACGKCNQSKGNKNWKDWMISDAKLSPKTRGIKDLSERMSKLERYEKTHPCKKYDFERIAGEDLWKLYMEKQEMLHEMMDDSQRFVNTVKEVIEHEIKEGA